MKVADSDILYAYEHFSTVEALKYLGIAQSTYYNRLNKLGINLKKQTKVYDEDIIKAFNSSKSIREAAEKIGMSSGAYYKRIQKLGLNFNDKHDLRKYNINDFTFTSINSEVAYWLGFIAADGSVVDNTLRFVLNKRDEETLVRFLKFCKSNYPVNYHIAYYIGNDGVKHEFDAVNLKITSKSIVNDLAKYGIIQNKKNLDIPFMSFIPSKYKLDFIIGYFDGDGSVTNGNSKTLTLATNYANINEIINVLESYGIKCNTSNREHICVIYINGKDNFNKFKLLYTSRNYSVMKRKLNEFNK